MKQLTISFASAASKREYPIYIGSHLIDKIGTIFDVTHYSNLFIITDETVAELFLDTIKKQLPSNAVSFVLPPGEKAKDVLYLTKIWEAMIDAKLDRKSLVINLGGGVIGDIGGFAASTYMRGIDFINIPTTLLSQVDESVGGKTMIDHHGIKNIIGIFYQPSAVIIDVDTIKSLPENQLLSGFGEIIKHGLVKDKNYFETVTAKKPSEFTDNEITDIIKRSCEIKSEIIQADEKEADQRKILNFGHTIGHAVEALSLETNKPLLHGEAISIGMIKEAELAVELGILSQKDLLSLTTKLADAGLPTKLPKMNADDVIAKMKLDKKNSRGEINFTLIKNIGEAVINQTVPDEAIKKILGQS
jgi:3-dehydroquinate synthase